MYMLDVIYLTCSELRQNTSQLTQCTFGKTITPPQTENQNSPNSKKHNLDTLQNNCCSVIVPIGRERTRGDGSAPGVELPAINVPKLHVASVGWTCNYKVYCRMRIQFCGHFGSDPIQRSLQCHVQSNVKVVPNRASDSSACRRGEGRLWHFVGGKLLLLCTKIINNVALCFSKLFSLHKQK